MSFWANKLNNEPVKTAPVPSRDLFSLYNSPAIPQQAPQQHSIPANQEYQPSVRLKEGGHCPGCEVDPTIAGDECFFVAPLGFVGVSNSKLPPEPATGTTSNTVVKIISAANATFTIQAGV